MTFESSLSAFGKLRVCARTCLCVFVCVCVRGRLLAINCWVPETYSMPQLQVSSRKRAINSRALVRKQKMTQKDKVFYGPWPPCNATL